MSKILILEDNQDCISVYRDLLDEHELIFTTSLQEFQAQLQHRQAVAMDLLLADLILPDGQFLEWISTNQNSFIEGLPTIIVSSIADETLLANCFEWGAIDYLIKPFNPGELKVKVAKGLGHFQLNKSMQKGQEIPAILEELTKIEARIFQQLLEARGAYVSRQQLMQQVWKKVSVNTKTLDVHLSNTRRKIATTNWNIECEETKGWRLVKKSLPSIS